jgi:16S rRNA (cytidine1402-2'-O)-methyltransferase
MNGHLTLIPTPIDDLSPLCQKTIDTILLGIKNKDLILVEEHKANRRRWIQHGLPRESIEDFVLYNEHTRDELKKEILADLKKGRNAMLLSDCGLPAFCDPGQELVDLCHQQKIKVTATPFSNSIALAIALSGFKHDKFMFEGFIPVKRDERIKELKRILNNNLTSILMDTPYRLGRLLEEVQRVDDTRDLFLGLDLNQETEELHRGNASSMLKKIKELKREFILIVGSR